MCGSQVINVGAFGRNAKWKVTILFWLNHAIVWYLELLRLLWNWDRSSPFHGELWSLWVLREICEGAAGKDGTGAIAWSHSAAAVERVFCCSRRENMYSLLSLLPLLHSAASIGGCCCSQVSGFLISTGACSRGFVVTLEHCHCHCNNHSPTKVWNTVAELRSCGRRKQILFTS